MAERLDPYFEERLEKARQHRVLRSIEITNQSGLEVASNKELPHPIIEGKIEDFGWNEKSVENIIDAIETGKIAFQFLESGHLRIEFLPLKVLPLQLGHLAELDVIQRNLKNDKIFGPDERDQLTYLQTVDFAVEGYLDDENDGTEYGRVYVATNKLLQKRNIYLDPESLHITDYEYGFSFCVKGGVPREAITRIDVIRANKLARKRESIDTSDWPDDAESARKQMQDQAERLQTYLKAKLAQT